MTRTRHTSRDLDLLPYEEGARYEIIDGEIYVSKQPHWHHQLVCNNTGTALGQWSVATGLGFVAQAPGIVFSEDNDVAPDVVWASRERIQQTLDRAGHFTAAPELVIEILSPGSENLRRDREAKLALYDRRDVQEYWMLDWVLRQVEVYRRQEGRLLAAATLAEGETLTSPLLPGFSCPVSDLFFGVGPGT